MALADVDQVDRATVSKRLYTDPTPDTGPATYEATLTVDSLEVFDEPSERSYVVSDLSEGETVRVRGSVAGGWLAIDPPPTVICWIEQSALRASAGRTGQDGHIDVGKGRSAGPGTRAWVSVSAAVIRFGNPQARMPGPPRTQLTQGTMVRLVDRPPLRVGRGAAATVWYAIVPPAEGACYIRAAGARKVESSRAPAAEIQASYVAVQEAQSPAARSAKDALSPDITNEIDSVESLVQSIKKGRPISQWQFHTARSRYEAIRKRADGNPAVEEAIRAKLADVTRLEQAALAAQKIDTILAASHDRDQEVSRVERRVAQATQIHARAFNAVGFVQPSARVIDGHKLYALIGKNGSTLAYLDVPPGLDVEPLFSHRVGVRGVTHYSEELGARMIAVRDFETIGTR
jgi:hypothetical protein